MRSAPDHPSNRQLAQTRARGGEDGVGDGRGHRRHAGLTDAGGRLGARHDVDVRVPRRDTAEQASNYKDPSYSRERTQRLVELFRQNGFPVTHIFFNDPKVTGVSPWPNHDNHLHVRFDINAADDATS